MAKCTEHRHEKNFGARRLPGNTVAHAGGEAGETEREKRRYNRDRRSKEIKKKRSGERKERE